MKHADVQHNKLDFEHARTKHLLFKARLRAILYGLDASEGPVVSHRECAVGQWIYEYGLSEYGFMPEMRELEQVHRNLHVEARRLVELFHQGHVTEARQELPRVEDLSEQVLLYLNRIESEVHASSVHTPESDPLKVNLSELQELLRLNALLDRRIRDQQQHLYRTKERFELLARATQDALWDWDLTTNEVWWNEGFCTLFGYGPGELTSGLEAWKAHLHPDDRDRILESLLSLIGSGSEQQWTSEYRFRRKDGSYAMILDRAHVVHDADGRPLRMLGAMQDVTERHEAESALERKVKARTQDLETLNEELRRTNENLEEFVYAASHDLKEPIRKVLFFTDLLRETLAGTLTPSQQSYLERTRQASVRMRTLIDDVMIYSEVSHGTAQHRPIDLNKKIALVLEDLDLEIEQKNALVEVAPLPTVRGNARQIQQLLQNLIGNALRYGRPGVPPVVRIGCSFLTGKDCPLPLPASEQQKRFYCITVSDNGLGFNAEDAERIFNLFTRLGGDPANKGSGIGLSIVRKIAENHGGYVWAESKPGEGAAFHVLLPVPEGELERG